MEAVEIWNNEETGITAKLYYEEYPELDWDFFSQFHFFGKYDYLTRTEESSRQGNKFREYREPEEIVKEYQGGILFPIFLYDHGSITISTGSQLFRACDSYGWDWGQAGFVGITAEKIRKEYGKKRISKKVREQAEKLLLAEVETYDEYLRGEVFFGCVEDSEGNHLDSCGGFFGFDYAKEQTKEMFEYAVKEKIKLDNLPPYED